MDIDDIINGWWTDGVYHPPIRPSGPSPADVRRMFDLSLELAGWAYRLNLQSGLWWALAAQVETVLDDQKRGDRGKLVETMREAARGARILALKMDRAAAFATMFRPRACWTPGQPMSGWDVLGPREFGEKVASNLFADVTLPAGIPSSWPPPELTVAAAQMTAVQVGIEECHMSVYECFSMVHPVGGPKDDYSNYLCRLVEELADCLFEIPHALGKLASSSDAVLDAVDHHSPTPRSHPASDAGTEA